LRANLRLLLVGKDVDDAVDRLHGRVGERRNKVAGLGDDAP
jgi:hypothetical protein